MSKQRKHQVVTYISNELYDSIEELRTVNPHFMRMSKSACYNKLMRYGLDCVKSGCQHVFEIYDEKKRYSSEHRDQLHPVCIRLEEEDYQMLGEMAEGLSISCLCFTLLCVKSSCAKIMQDGDGGCIRESS